MATDAPAIEGVDGMLRCARAYAEAGADMIFADAIRTEYMAITSMFASA